MGEEKEERILSKEVLDILIKLINEAIEEYYKEHKKEIKKN